MADGGVGPTLYAGVVRDEAGLAGHEGEFDVVAGAVALLGDDDDGFVEFIGVGVHPFLVAAVHDGFAVQEHDDVGILLDAAGFAEVAGAGEALFGFAGAIELREAEDGDVEFAGEGFDAAGDRGDFLLAVVGLAGGFHELEVVDGDEFDVVLELEAAGLGAEVHEGEAGGIVDEDLALREFADGVGEAVAVLFGEHAAAEFVGIDAGAGAEHTLGELLFGHFEGEDGAGLFFVDADVFNDVHGEGGFTDGGACSDDDHFAALEAGGEVVEFDEAGLDAGEMFAGLAVEHFEGFVEDVGERDGLVGGFLLGDFEDASFAAVEDGGGGFAGVVAVAEGAGAGGDERAEHGFFFDDGGVIFGVGGGGDGAGEFFDVVDAADLVEEVLGFEGGVEDHRVDGGVGFEELGEDAEDDLVFFLEEDIGFLEEHADGADDLGVDDHGAEDAGFGGEVVWGHAVDELDAFLGAGAADGFGAGGGGEGGHGAFRGTGTTRVTET